MKVSLAGLVETAAGMLKPGASRKNAAYYVFGLEELARHARETADGKHNLAEFADLYCLTEPAPLVLTETDYPLEG